MNDQINEAGEQLESAFQLFNQFSEKLAGSYADLEGQVARLSKELSNERSARLTQLAEKEKLAKRLESLFDALPAGVVVLDSAGCITQTNRIAQQMLGFETHNKQWQTLAANIFVSDGDELRLKDGRWVNLSASQLNDHAEKILLISDVSETHALNEMLNRQQRLSSLGEMIASLAHQIRTPLASALLNISNSNHPANNENRRSQFTEKAKERLRHLERMVDDMLIFARGDVSDAEYMRADLFCRQLEKVIEADYNAQHIYLELHRNLKGVNIKANTDVLSSAILNIVDNAIEACDSEKKIEIKALLNEQNKFEINIKDNGHGMTEKTIARVLEPFFTTRSNGTGLGLAVVNETVNRYNGKINIDSTPGEGSNFNIQFPCSEENGMLHSTLTDINWMMMHTGSQLTGHQEVQL